MTEQQRIEELMKPRFKVIADYFHSPYKVGDLVELSLGVPYPSFLSTVTIREDFDGKPQECANWTQLTAIDKFPHLFKRLQWYEDRKPEELRCIEYVKWVDTSAEGRMEFIEKVIEIESRGKENYFKVASQVNTIRLEYFTPATLAEYNQYINSNQ